MDNRLLNFEGGFFQPVIGQPAGQRPMLFCIEERCYKLLTLFSNMTILAL